jgi:hypothetical protein
MMTIDLPDEACRLALRPDQGDAPLPSETRLALEHAARERRVWRVRVPLETARDLFDYFRAAADALATGWGSTAARSACVEAANAVGAALRRAGEWG